MNRDRASSWLLAPFLAGSAVLVVIPGVLGLAIAFFSYDGLSPPVWVGLGNFRLLASDDTYFAALRSSLVLVALAVPIRVGGALGLALLLQRRSRLVGVSRVAAFAPVATPEVATALVWLWILNPLAGPIALVGRMFGTTPGPLLLEPTGARLALVAIVSFAVGEGFLVLLAARQELPDTLLDAARVEGAGPWMTFRRVLLPALTPTLSLLVVRDIGMSLQATTVPALLLSRGGPNDATRTIPFAIYDEGFANLRFGVAGALSALLFVTVVIVALVQLRLLRRFTAEWVG